jgi:hypothetical protein
MKSLLVILLLLLLSMTFVVNAAIQTPTPLPTFAPTATRILPTPLPTLALTETPIVPTPTSNAAEIRAMRENTGLLLNVQFEEACYLADDFIPFTIEVINTSTGPFYFYENGRWMLSINNSPVGPSLVIAEPSLRDDFTLMEVSDTFIREEFDLGLWVLSLSFEEDADVPLSETGLGLPPGDYWITFVYQNDKDGLTEQPDGTFLIPRAAWRGTAISQERRIRVVSDLTECEEE